VQIVRLIIIGVIIIVSCTADAAKIRRPDAPEIRIVKVEC
jgi:hypothetical protein